MSKYVDDRTGRVRAGKSVSALLSSTVLLPLPDEFPIAALRIPCGRVVGGAE